MALSAEHQGIYDLLAVIGYSTFEATTSDDQRDYHEWAVAHFVKRVQVYLDTPEKRESFHAAMVEVTLSKIEESKNV